MNTLMVALYVFSGLLSLPMLRTAPVALKHMAEDAKIPLKAPPGWKSQTGQGATVMIPGDLGEGKVYTVFITPLQTKAGTLDEVYGIAKKTIGDVGTFAEATKPQQAQSDGGWDYKVSIGTLEKDGKALLAQVMAVKKGEVGGVVLVLGDGIETLQKYSDPFTNMIRSLGTSGKLPAAPEITHAPGTVELQYTIPQGWTETKKSGVTVIEISKDDFYTKYRWTLAVMPSQPLTGSLRDHFKEYWKELITANYDSSVAPLPLMARLSDGYVCAFDADNYVKHKVTGARPRSVSVYLLAHGNRFVPILAVLYGYEKQIDTDLERFLTTARIPGSSNTKIPLFSSKEIAGDWSEGSSSIASYVTASGSYAGDASIYTGSSFHLKPDGSYKYTFIGITSTAHLKEAHEGRWSLEDNELVLKDPKETTRYSLLGCGVDPKAGKFLVLGTYSNVKANLSFSNPRGPFQASWYKIK